MNEVYISGWITQLFVLTAFNSFIILINTTGWLTSKITKLVSFVILECVWTQMKVLIRCEMAIIRACQTSYSEQGIFNLTTSPDTLHSNSSICWVEWLVWAGGGERGWNICTLRPARLSRIMCLTRCFLIISILPYLKQLDSWQSSHKDLPYRIRDFKIDIHWSL
jgi:hypothetical protein